MRVIAVGEILWDLIGGEEFLGGAVLNFSVHTAHLGNEVSMISAVGADPRGQRALAKIGALGLAAEYILSIPGQPTGTVTVTVDSAGQPSYVIHRPAAYDFVTLDEAGLGRLAALQPDWIAYGTLHSKYAAPRQLLKTVVDRCPQARHFYDINLRKDSFTASLVADLLQLADVVKLNESEVRAVEEMFGAGAGTLESFCRTFAFRFGWLGVCVTRGENGCALLLNGEYVELDGYPVRVADAVGAGDAFAAGLLHGVQAGWPARQIGDFANRLGALVASRPGGTPEWSIAELRAVGAAR
jgi:fructokinase